MALTLRNSRTRLHRHLFIALVIQVAIRLTVYTDQLITRGIEVDGNATKQDNNLGRRGIDNTVREGQQKCVGYCSTRPYLCEASYISLEYARTAMFMWMFVEGLFLHNMITVTVFEERLSPIVYPMVGWVVPIPLTVVWAVVTHWQCWWGYNFTGYFWILEGPRLAVLMVNLAFLLNILRVLVMKLRQSNSSETQQALKAVKAALVLLPLLGLTNLLNMLDAPLEKSPFQFALWSYTTHLLTSTQGFILAFLYCFRNGEVQMAVRKFVHSSPPKNFNSAIIRADNGPLPQFSNPIQEESLETPR
ncbi:PDF receptor [Orchesella cincta]|uniref:PDF receptor n=1 Tax=Orchesella cincta TaxID=48709 RepID=A0A1D2NLM9_ORCCI|nr:PDF receptor [Orchesella cincta]